MFSDNTCACANEESEGNSNASSLMQSPCNLSNSNTIQSTSSESPCACDSHSSSTQPQSSSKSSGKYSSQQTETEKQVLPSIFDCVCPIETPPCVCKTSTNSIEPQPNFLTNKEKPVISNMVDCICPIKDSSSCSCSSSETDSSISINQNNEPTSQQKPYYTEQLRVQDKFWTTTIQQLCDHIKDLEEKKHSTENVIGKMESFLMPYITHKMVELSQSKPNLEIDKLLTLELPETCSSSKTEKLPDLPTLEFFAIQDNDLLYMDLIKARVEEANKLQTNINNLQTQGMALIRTKNKINEMAKVKPKNIPDKLNVNSKLMSDLKNRLENDKIDLLKQIDEEKEITEKLEKSLAIALEDLDDVDIQGKLLRQDLNYAGANIEIANSVNRTGLAGIKEDALKTFQNELEALNSEYGILKDEMINLQVELDELRKGYTSKMTKSSCSCAEARGDDCDDCIETRDDGNCKCPDNKKIIDM